MTIFFEVNEHINAMLIDVLSCFKERLKSAKLGLLQKISLIVLLSVNSSVIAISPSPLQSSIEIDKDHAIQTSLHAQPKRNDHENEQFRINLAAREKLAIKLYRKALFYYFQAQPELALRQLSYNKARLGVVDDNALLFEAGLQVSLGFYRQAEKNLTTITDKLSSLPSSDVNHSGLAKTNVALDSESRFDYFASRDLLAVALLQLAEQQINQQQHDNAKQTLAKISRLPNGYYQQYHILNQLAYWPELPKMQLKKASSAENSALKTEQDKQADAYILLNTALMHIEQKDMESAEQKLSTLKLMSWLAPQQSFWQQLFSSELSASKFLSSDSTKESNVPSHEQQSLKDYASLLLAQLYVEQEKFSLAYKELAHYPQNSPFTEQALFLFAYASLQTQHYAESEAIFSLLSTRYPASYLSWQADVLLARQYLVQRNLDTALQQYMHLESKYLEQLESLSSFEQQLITAPKTLLESLTLPSQQTFMASLWWQKARASVQLTGQFEQANELEVLNKKIAQQQQQVQWTGYALALNENRQTKIIAQQQAQNYQERITHLQRSRDQLANSLNKASSQVDANVFASKQQQLWLKRIAESQNIINVIASSEHYKNRIPKYQQRLSRIENVLSWQLKQSLPERLWQHRNQLQQLDNALAKLQKQFNQIVAIQTVSALEMVNNANNHNVENHESENSLMSKAGIDLPTLKQRHEKIAQNSTELTKSIAVLSHLTNDRIKLALSAFITEQRSQLNYYLHHSRRAMAKILEEFKKVDTPAGTDDNGAEQ